MVVECSQLAGLGVGGQVRMGLPDLGQRVGAGHRDRIGVPTLGKQPLPLRLTDPELLGDFGLGVGLIRRGHDLPA